MIRPIFYRLVHFFRLCAPYPVFIGPPHSIRICDLCHFQRFRHDPLVTHVPVVMVRSGRCLGVAGGAVPRSLSPCGFVVQGARLQWDQSMRGRWAAWIARLLLPGHGHVMSLIALPQHVKLNVILPLN
jgi:hypothetical protein